MSNNGNYGGKERYETRFEKNFRFNIYGGK
jgi:hypothetical protein